MIVMRDYRGQRIEVAPRRLTAGASTPPPTSVQR
jgi:hypothetical protein